MSNNTKCELSKAQNIILGVTAITFIVLVWKMIPAENALKAAMCCFFGALIILMVLSFANYLGYYKIITSSKMATAVTIVIFVVFPLAISIMHGVHEKEYLKSYPSDNQISVKISEFRWVLLKFYRFFTEFFV